MAEGAPVADSATMTSKDYYFGWSLVCRPQNGAAMD
jgi:hypothetical protein